MHNANQVAGCILPVPATHSTSTLLTTTHSLWKWNVSLLWLSCTLSLTHFTLTPALCKEATISPPSQACPALLLTHSLKINQSSTKLAKCSAHLTQTFLPQKTVNYYSFQLTSTGTYFQTKSHLPNYLLHKCCHLSSGHSLLQIKLTKVRKLGRTHFLSNSC